MTPEEKNNADVRSRRAVGDAHQAILFIKTERTPPAVKMRRLLNVAAKAKKEAEEIRKKIKLEKGGAA